MKFSICLAALFLQTSISALAQPPAVGDHVTLSGTSTDCNNVTHIITDDMLLTAMDCQKQTFTANITYSTDGVGKTYTGTYGDWSCSDITEAQVAADCNAPNDVDGAAAGVMESLTTPAGTFQACHYWIGLGERWYAAVPFGLVKEVGFSEDSGANWSIELTSYSFGSGLLN